MIVEKDFLIVSRLQLNRLVICCPLMIQLTMEVGKEKVYMQTEMSERDAILSLLLIKGLGSKRFFRLKEAFGTPAGIWRHANRDRLKGLVPGSVAGAIEKGPDRKGLDELKKACQASGIWLLFYDDPDYPEPLKNIHDPPVVLFGRGQKQVLSTRCVAVVGSRKASTYGRRVCAMLAGAVARAGLTVVSGLAIGIDAFAHKAAVECGGFTIAVKGCGIDVDYPIRNVRLAEKISEQGAVISEFFPGISAEPGNFPSRNRIISGLSLGVLVVEAGSRSGSLITAYLALEQGREVMAVPANIFSFGGRGCHKLIKEGATLVESAEDVFQALDMGGLLRKESSFVRGRSVQAISEEAAAVIDKLEADPQHIDDIAVKCSMTVSRVSSILIELELQDMVISHRGGMYSLSNRNE